MRVRHSLHLHTRARIAAHATQWRSTAFPTWGELLLVALRDGCGDCLCVVGGFVSALSLSHQCTFKWHFDDPTSGPCARVGFVVLFHLLVVTFAHVL